MPKEPHLQTFHNGFHPTVTITSEAISTGQGIGQGAVKNSIRDGRGVFVESDGSLITANGIGSSLGAGALRMYLVDDQIGFVDDGSVISYMGGSYFYTGDNIRVGSVLSVSSTGGYIGFQINGTQYLAGLSVGPTPGLILVPLPATGKVTGSVAVKLTRRRTLTAGEGNPGPSSLAVTGKNSKIRITIPAADFGQDAWGLYATFAGFGLEGPFYFFKQLIVGVDVPMGGGTIDTDYYNSELSTIEPPTNHFPPSKCLYVVSLSNVVAGMGGFGGTGIQPSIPGDPESYPLSTVLVTTPPEAIQGVIPRAGENELPYWTLDSIQSLVYTGEADAPLLIRSRWPQAGVQSRHGLCQAESDIYAYSGQGILRIIDGSSVDTSFATPVQRYVKSLGVNAADVVVGYDQLHQHVVYFLGASLLALVFNRQSEKWSPPLVLPGWAASAVTLQGVLNVSLVVGSTGLYTWESGTGTSYYVMHDWFDDPVQFDRKTFLGVKGVLDPKGTATKVELYKDFDLSTTFLTINNPAQQLANFDWDVSMAGYLYHQIQAKISGTGAGHTIVGLQYLYDHIPGQRY